MVDFIDDDMKQIIITPKRDEIVQVCITDDQRYNERNVFLCPLGSIYEIIKVNINLKY